MDNNRVKVKWIGIDFGTTNSAAITFLNEGSSIGRYEHGDDQGTPFPSIVGINKKTGEVITGRDAKNRRMELSENYKFFTSLKSILDKDEYYEDVGGKKWTPVTLASEILKGLKNEADYFRSTICQSEDHYKPLYFALYAIVLLTMNFPM